MMSSGLRKGAVVVVCVVALGLGLVPLAEAAEAVESCGCQGGRGSRSGWRGLLTMGMVLVGLLLLIRRYRQRSRLPKDRNKRA